MSYSVKPGRGVSFLSAITGLIVGVPFLLFWISKAPGEMKWFGILGLLLLIGGSIFHFYNATARNRITEVDIVRTGHEKDPIPDWRDRPIDSPAADSADRLRELENLRDEGLITEEEFRKKRDEILEEL